MADDDKIAGLLERIDALESRLADAVRNLETLKASIGPAANAEAEKVLSTLTIKNGQYINFSGAGRAITANVTIPQGVLQGSVQCVDNIGVLTGSVTFG